MVSCAGDVPHSTRVAWRVAWMTALAAGVMALGGGLSAFELTGPQQLAVRHNPHGLHATATLEHRPPGTPTPVRFEWEQVPGAREYLLSGRWTSPPSWAVQRREYRVTSRNAASWTARSVAFETALPEGNHSWGLVALFGARLATHDTGSVSPRLVGDFANPTTLSFDVP